jgi:hypothetical protein
MMEWLARYQKKMWHQRVQSHELSSPLDVASCLIADGLVVSNLRSHIPSREKNFIRSSTTCLHEVPKLCGVINTARQSATHSNDSNLLQSVVYLLLLVFLCTISSVIAIILLKLNTNVGWTTRSNLVEIREAKLVNAR